MVARFNYVNRIYWIYEMGSIITKTQKLFLILATCLIICLLSWVVIGELRIYFGEYEALENIFNTILGLFFGAAFLEVLK